MNEPPISEHIYRDQMAMIPVGKTSYPTFWETLRLEPGIYHVEVLLHVFPANFDINTFPGKDAKLVGHPLSYFRNITIR